MEDKTREVQSHKDTVTKDTEHLLGGRTHRLICQSKRSKRISRSTSHAETLACVSTMQHEQLIALRYTEVLTGCCVGIRRPLATLMDINDRAAFLIPIDHCTDCFDLFQLVCGLKGIPTDKTQRLAILSVREDRLCGRVRNFIHLPTNAMVMDGLTKTGTFPELMRLISAGFFKVFSPSNKFVSMRIAKPKSQYTENDLIHLDY